jgi:TPR repeat protein
VRKDPVEAEKWHLKAAEQDFAPAQFNLGVMYYEGRVVRRDNAEALKWYRLAAEQDFAPAQFNLGFFYVPGGGLPVDFVQAYMWFHLAAKRAPASNSEFRERAKTAADEVAAKAPMTIEQIVEAQKLAEEWKPK